jgi:hypothetical protein
MKKFSKFIAESSHNAVTVHKVTNGDERGGGTLPKQGKGFSHTSKDTHYGDEHNVVHHYSKWSDDGKTLSHANIHATHKSAEDGRLRGPEKAIKSTSEHKELTSKGFDHKGVSAQAVRTKEPKNYGAHVTARQE